MIRVAGYCRVSTDQTDQLNSLEAQKRYFREYVRQRTDWELFAVYADEGITGTNTKKREAFNRMIAEAKDEKFDLIITKEVSRFSRNILDTIAYTRELKACGVGVLFLTDGISTLEPDAELRLSIMASIAQEESRRTSSRVKWGQTRQMEQGVVFGHTLLGYNLKKGVLAVNEEEAVLVRRIFRLYGVEKRSTGEIASLLTAEGRKKANGSDVWTSRYILRVLKNEKYAGDLIQKKSYTPDYLNHIKKTNKGEEEKIILRDHHTAIVDRELWERVQEEIHRRDTRRGKRKRVIGSYAFSGKIFCGECGAPFVRRQRIGKDGAVSYRWSCSRAVRKGGCMVGHLVREDDAVNMLLQVLKELSFDCAEVAEHTAQLVMAAAYSTEETIAQQESGLRREKEKLLAKKDRALDAYLSGLIGKEDLQRMKERCDSAVQRMEDELAAVKQNCNTSIENSELSEEMQNLIYGVLSAERFSEAFVRNLPLQLTVFRDRPMELRLPGLEQVFYFQYDRKQPLKRSLDCGDNGTVIQ